MESETNIQFSLTVTTSLGTKILTLNEPFYDVVMKKSDKMYSLHIDPVTSFLMISRNIMSYEDKPIIYVGD